MAKAKNLRKASKKGAATEVVAKAAAPVEVIAKAAVTQVVTAGDKELYLASIAEAAYEVYRLRCNAEKRGDLETSRRHRAEGKELVRQARTVFPDFRMKDWIAARKAFRE